MNIFNVLNMLGGLALFLYGMTIMGEGLTKLSGGRLERILEKLTSNPLKAVLLGAGVTAVIQSSSATTVMVVGFVNSGIMKLSQAIGIIMGANIGTTVTSWILSLSGIEGDSLWVQMLKPSTFSPVLAFVGIILFMFVKNQKKKDIGVILVGFAILMTGMDAMSGAVKPLADVPEFIGLFTLFKNPILGMAVGALLTAVIQSSSASVGILQALCMTGSVTYGAAFPIIMGQNIGTCVTALISSVGASINAKRAAFVHLYFNIIGTILFSSVFYLINSFVHFEFMEQAAGAAGIAVIHSVFNVAATIVLLPFSKGLEKLSCLTIHDKEDGKEKTGEMSLLDVRFLEQPSFAIEQCKKLTITMAELAKKGLQKSMELLEHYEEDSANEVKELEELVDRYEDQIGTYLVKLSGKNLSLEDSHTLSVLLHCIGDFERISDHSVNIMESAMEMHQKEMYFSEDAKKELMVFENAIHEIVTMAFQVFSQNDTKLAMYVEPLEEVIDGLNVKIKTHHIKRLRKGECTIDLGFVLSDLTTNFERVADHCSNIAVCLLQVEEDSFDTHEYLEDIKRNDPAFQEKVESYKISYQI